MHRIELNADFFRPSWADACGSLVQQFIPQPAIDGEDGPAPSAPAICWQICLPGKQEPSVMNVATIGLDISKYAFHGHAVDAEGRLTCRCGDEP
jgi:hypothetical protein